MGGLSSLANVIYGTISVDESAIVTASYGKRPDVLPAEEGTPEPYDCVRSRGVADKWRHTVGYAGPGHIKFRPHLHKLRPLTFPGICGDECAIPARLRSCN